MLKRLRLTKLHFINLVLLLLTSCAAPSTQIIPTETASPIPTEKPTNTVVPTATGIPGFEDWSVFNPQAVDSSTENGSLILTLKRRALWFMQERGVLVYKSVDGDFRITADVHTAKISDPAQPPGGDGTVQLGGLMARNSQGGLENCVFIVVGDDGNGLSAETKNTVDSLSKYDSPGWDAAEAELRICRVGAMLNLYKRHVDSNGPWILAASFERSDLPATLQVGVNIYSDSSPDLKIRYDNIKLETVSSPSDCETD